MNFYEYRLNAKRKILAEFYRCKVYMTEDNLCIYDVLYKYDIKEFERVANRNEIIRWLNDNGNLFEILNEKENYITVKLLNCPPKQPETEYDTKIIELEKELKLLKELQRKKLIQIKNDKKIAQLKNEIKELQKEAK